MSVAIQSEQKIETRINTHIVHTWASLLPRFSISHSQRHTENTGRHFGQLFFQRSPTQKTRRQTNKHTDTRTHAHPQGHRRPRTQTRTNTGHPVGNIVYNLLVSRRSDDVYFEDTLSQSASEEWPSAHHNCVTTVLRTDADLCGVLPTPFPLPSNLSVFGG